MTQACAFNVYHLGGTTGNPWQAALSFTPGEYLTIKPDGTLQDRGRLRAPLFYPTWQETLAVFVDSLEGAWLRPFFILDTLNLAQDGIRDRISRGKSSNLTLSGNCGDAESGILRIRTMFDGNPNTATFFTISSAMDPQLRRVLAQNVIADLGVDYPISRIRFFPRLGRNNPQVDELLHEMAPPRLRKEALGAEDFSKNYLPWFEVAGASSLHNLPPECWLETDETPWFLQIPDTIGNAHNDTRFTILGRDTENHEVVVDIRFPVQLFRWVALRPLDLVRDYEIAEVQIFGTGYVPRAVYTSAVLDLGEPRVLGKIRWSGKKDRDARILIRTRSGSDEDPNRYWVTNSTLGEPVEITREEYERAPAFARTITSDDTHWSFWSAPYPWESGFRDSTLAEHLWQDGTSMLSPGPARYLQLQIVFLSTVTQGARLRDLEVQFARPAAQAVVAEIWPLDVSRGKRTTFTYSMRPDMVDGDLGFDHVEIFTLTRADTVRSVKVDALEVSRQFPPHILEDRIIVDFPRLQGNKDTAKLITVVFDAQVVRYGTEFQSWVFASEDSAVKQLSRPGNANPDFPGNTLGVRTGSLGAGLLAQVEVSPNPFTPDGDVINETVRFRFQLHEVSAPRPLTLHIYDMAGQQIRRVDSMLVVRGLFGEEGGGLAWDGRDDQGRRVVPGIYLYRLFLDVDQGAEEKIGTIYVVY